jgi:hypothetical protein
MALYLFVRLERYLPFANIDLVRPLHDLCMRVIDCNPLPVRSNTLVLYVAKMAFSSTRV